MHYKSLLDKNIVFFVLLPTHQQDTSFHSLSIWNSAILCHKLFPRGILKHLPWNLPSPSSLLSFSCLKVLVFHIEGRTVKADDLRGKAWFMWLESPSIWKLPWSRALGPVFKFHFEQTLAVVARYLPCWLPYRSLQSQEGANVSTQICFPASSANEGSKEM